MNTQFEKSKSRQFLEFSIYVVTVPEDVQDLEQYIREEAISCQLTASAEMLICTQHHSLSQLNSERS